jgi:hypothetical protein
MAGQYTGPPPLYPGSGGSGSGGGGGLVGAGGGDLACVDVVVPSGMPPGGAPLTLRLPDGRVLIVPVPAGCLAGTVLRVPLPPTAAAAPNTTFFGGFGAPSQASAAAPLAEAVPVAVS